MAALTGPYHRAVQRQRAYLHIRYLLISFAATVAITRLYLTLTGFPQVGNQTLHIAHLLWGGLFLFISVLLMVIYANKWVYSLGAVLGGVGVGLFIDEVGKFITRSYNYFYPPAAPIIYTLLLLVVLIYVEVRRPPKYDSRTELYRVFDSLLDVLDHNLDLNERTALRARLKYIISRAEQPDFTRLAKDLLYFIDSKAVVIVEPKPSRFKQISVTTRHFVNRLISRSQLKGILVIGLVAVGIWSTVDLLTLTPLFSTPASLQNMLVSLVASARITGTTSLHWFIADAASKAACGLVLLIAAALLVSKQDKQGLAFSYLGILILITVVDLLEFYFDQFGTILPSALHFGLLLIMLYYRGMVDPGTNPRVSLESP